MVQSTAAVIGLLGVVATVATFAWTLRDARRNEIRRPRLWAALAAVPIAIGFGLYLFVPAAPMTGVLLTANTGLVLYGFTREVANEDEEPPEPGQLPFKE